MKHKPKDLTWYRSDNGNSCMRFEGYLTTVFKRNGDWTFIASELVDLDDVEEQRVWRYHHDRDYPLRDQAKKFARRAIVSRAIAGKVILTSAFD